MKSILATAITGKALKLKNTEDLELIIDAYNDFKGRRLGQLLMEMGLISQQQLAQALKECKKTEGLRLGEALLKKGIINVDHLSVALLAQGGVPWLDLSGFSPAKSVIDMIPKPLVEQLGILPLAVLKGCLVVASSHPHDSQIQKLIGFQTRMEVFLVGADAVEISSRIMRSYGVSDEELQHVRIRGGSQDDSPIARFNQSLLLHALHSHATDIHFQPRANEIEVFFRIDGQMTKIRNLERDLYVQCVSRIKVVSGMDVTKRHLPQDGRARVLLKQGHVDVRVSTVPTQYGESVALRLFDQRNGPPSLDRLGLRMEDLSFIRTLIHEMRGLVLMTGPTGSGKSSSLYAMLNEASTLPAHLVSVEDPIEIEVPGCQQIEVSSRHGRDFAGILRQLLRHDPDLVMVGEIRDEETARVVNRVALSGHMALSSLHTHDAASAAVRLADMGVKPYMLADTLRGVIASRLVRNLCSHCKKPRRVGEGNVQSLLGVSSGHTVYAPGQGCAYCHGSGYVGRSMVYEMLKVDHRLAEAIAAGADSAKLRKIAVAGGMKMMPIRALELARDGNIALQDALDMVRNFWCPDLRRQLTSQAA